MKRKLMMAALSLCGIGLMLSGPAYAEGFLFGEETKGVTVSANDSDLNIRIRLQPRFDYGDLITSKDGKSYDTEGDIYMRRVRIEMSGHLMTKTIKYNLTFAGDKWDKMNTTPEIIVFYSYVEWEPLKEFALIAGKEKLPYSRVSLTSSSKQLLIERAVSTEAAKKVFGSTDPYYQPKIAAKGKLADGVVAYEAAIADGWQSKDTVSSRTVQKADLLYVARVELSPPGWVEGKKADTHLGKGQHLTLAADYANQSAIEYTTAAGYKEKRSLYGVDLSGHYNGFTGQIEYNEWKVDSDDPAVADTKPKGWYAQAGYYIDGLNIEPAVRYEVYNQDSNSSNKTEKDTTLGINWYGKGHSLKVGLNWVHTKYDSNASGKLANDDKKDVCQLQAQMYF